MMLKTRLKYVSTIYTGNSMNEESRKVSLGVTDYWNKLYFNKRY